VQPRKVSQTTSRPGAARGSSRFLQRLDQEEDFSGHPVVESRVVGEGAVAAPGDDGLESVAEGVEPRGFGIGGNLLLDASPRRPATAGATPYRDVQRLPVEGLWEMKS